MNNIDIRPSIYPRYNDNLAVRNYKEYFISGTNVKLGFSYVDNDDDKEYYFGIVTYKKNITRQFFSLDELFEYFNQLLMNQNLIWIVEDVKPFS